MKPVVAKVSLAAGLVIAGVGGLLVADSPEATLSWQRGLFLATVGVQLVALVGAVLARRGFDPGDPGRLTWTLIAAFLAIRILAETRLTTLYFGLVPGAITGSESAHFFYLAVLRYLYTISDVLFAAAVLTTIRAFRSTGLHVELQAKDWVLMAVVGAMPAGAFALRASLGMATLQGDTHILTYRLIAITLGSFVAILCIVVYRDVRQLRGGVLARVWGAMVLAGIARALSFLSLAVVATASEATAELIEQLLLWVFACSWWLATLEQRGMNARAG